MVDKINPAIRVLEIIMEAMTPEEFAEKIKASPENPTLKLIQSLFLSQPPSEIQAAAENVEVRKLINDSTKLANDIHELNKNWKP